MTQDPNTPKYNTTTGLLTDYGKSQGLSEVNKPIDPSQLKPATQPILQPTTPSNTSSITLSDISENANTATTSQDTAITDYLKSLTEQGNIQGKEAGIVTEQGGDIAKQEYTKYKNEIDQLSRDLEIKKRDIQQSGMTTQQSASEINALTKDTEQKQADKAILGNAALGRYNDALDVAKRKVESELAPIKAQLEAKKFYIEQKKDLWNAQQMAEANRVVKAEDAKIEEQKKIKDSIAEIKVNIATSDAPNKSSLLSQLNEIDSTKPDAMDKAIKLAGKYSGDYLKQQLLSEQIKTEKAQQSNIYANIAKTKSETGAGKPATQAQFTASGFAGRVVQSKDIIDANTTDLSKLSTTAYLAQRNLPNALQSPLIQKQLQAERNFVNAVLRRESGAAISPEEFKSAEKQYFPMPGDSSEVLAQKKANRDLTSQNIISESGTAYTAPVPPNPFQQALGQSNEKIPGTSIIQTMSNGVTKFNIPTN